MVSEAIELLRTVSANRRVDKSPKYFQESYMKEKHWIAYRCELFFVFYLYFTFQFSLFDYDE
jgi:hypothetical protein